MDTFSRIPNNTLHTEIPIAGTQMPLQIVRPIAAGQTVATEFATIAAANNYWKT